MTQSKITGWTVSSPDLDSKCLQHIANNQLQTIRGKLGQWQYCSIHPNQDTRVNIYNDAEITLVITGNPTIHDSSNDSFTPIKNKDQLAALLASYKRNGYHFLRAINGSFSIVLFDSNKQITLLAIDRMGIEQMHYHSNNEYLLFSNSLQSLSNLPPIDKQILPQSIYNYFYFHCIPSPYTIFKDLYKLKPAEVLIYKNGSTSSDTYWTPTFDERVAGNVDDLRANLKTAMGNTMRDYATREDIGAFLSGGTDSSTIAGLLKKHHADTAPTFSIGFEEQGYDEMGYAEIAVREFGNKHYQYYVNFEDVLRLLDEIPRIYEEPFGNSSVVPTYAAAQLAKQNGVNHLLGGDGGDELFGGNERYATQKLFNLYGSIPKWMRIAFVEPIFKNSVAGSIPGIKKAKSYIEQAKISMPMRMQTYNILHTQEPTVIFDNHYFAEIDSTQPLTLLSNTYNEINDASLLNRMLFLDWKFTLADNDIRKVNTMCHAADVEVSYPFLDNRVVDSSTKVPSHLKIKGLKLRSFYKDTYSDFLPAEIITKSKHGFGLPFGVWLKKDSRLQNAVYDALTNLKTRAMFQEKFIDDLIQKHRSEHAAYFGTFVWVLAVLELWLNAHQD